MISASLEISNKIEMIQLFLESLEDYVTSIESRDRKYEPQGDANVDTTYIVCLNTWARLHGVNIQRKK